MLDKLKNILLSLKDEQKPVWLFAVVKMDELADRWTLIISAPWVTTENRAIEFQSLVDKLKKVFDAKELESIARISFLTKDDHLTEELLKRHAGDKIKNEPVNGNIIHEGEIIESNPDLAFNPVSVE